MMKKAKKILFSGLLASALILGAAAPSAVRAHADDAPQAKTPIALGATGTTYKTLRDNKLAPNEGYFDAIRHYNPTELKGTADSEWYGHLGAYMGFSEEIDFTAVDSLSFEVSGVTVGETWLTFGLIDANGNVIRSMTTAAAAPKLNGADTSGNAFTDYVSPSTDWHGIYIGALHGEISVTSTDNFNTSAFSNKFGDAEKTAFDFEHVIGVATQIHLYDDKTIDTGKVTMHVGDDDTVLFDPATATKMDAPTSVKSLEASKWFSAVGVSKWANASALNADYSASGASISHLPKFQKDGYGTIKVCRPTGQTANDAWAAVGELDAQGNPVATYSDYTGYDGISFKLDTTACTTGPQVDVLYRVDGGADYKAFGNLQNVVFVPDQGDVVYTGAGNMFPKGFKGTVYMPFGAFQNGQAKLTSVADFASKASAMRFIVIGSKAEEGKTFEISNIQVYDCVDHVDGNSDHVCDYCSEIICTEHVDINHDQKCDVCGADVPCDNHYDGNHDQECDYCGAEVPCTEHVDSNHDQECDYCGAEVPCTEHYDGNEDGKCDYCGAKLGDGKEEKKSGGCGSVLSELSTVALTLTLAGAVVCTKKKHN